MAVLLAISVTLVTGCYRGHSPKVARPAIVLASQWGSNPDPIPADRAQRPDRITIHHAGVTWRAGDDPVQKLRGLQEWGKRERQWPDLPYHYLVAPDGRIFEGRPTSFVPESNTNYETRGHIGVQLWGNFEEQRVGREQLEATVHLVAWLCDQHVIPPSTILGHRDVAEGTVCPGDDLQRYIDEGDLRVWVAEMLARRQPDIVLKDALADGPVEWIPVDASDHAVP
jgi:hypothetical protein